MTIVKLREQRINARGWSWKNEDLIRIGQQAMMNGHEKDTSCQQ
jgi:hypothetical protein